MWRKDAAKPAVIGDIEMVCLDKDKQLQPVPADIKSDAWPAELILF